MIDDILQKAIEDKIFPGAVVGVINGSGKRQYFEAGNFEYDTGSPKITSETVYDVASITKSIPVALLALQLIEENKLSLDDNVKTYIPEIKNAGADDARIRHLLTYSYFLNQNQDKNFSYESADEKSIFKFLFERDVEMKPGTGYRYSNVPALLMGIIIERITGKKLYDLATEKIFSPLRMSDSTFYPENMENIPPTEIVSWRGKVQGTVHDETASILQKADLQPGCAGLFSNAPDILNAIEMLLNDGMFKNQRIIKEETVRSMETNQLESIGKRSGSGFELNQEFFMGKLAGLHTFGKTGFTGTCFVVDRQKGRGFVMLSNATFPKRPGSREPLNAVRRQISDIILDTNYGL